MLEDMDSAELTEWAAWEQFNGTLGSKRISDELSYLRCIVGAGFGAKKNKIQDWMLFKPPKTPTEPMTGEQIVSFFKQYTKAKEMKEAQKGKPKEP